MAWIIFLFAAGLGAGAAEVFVVEERTLLVNPQGESWREGEAVCVRRGEEKLACGKIVGFTPQGAQVELTQSEGETIEAGDLVDKVDAVSRVKEVFPFQTAVRAFQSPAEPWRLGDPACVYYGNQRLDCGEITEAGVWEAVLTFSAPSGKQIRPGYVVWRAPGSARVVWVEGSRIGVTQSRAFPWNPGDEFEVKKSHRSVARGRITGEKDGVMEGVLQSGTQNVEGGLWVSPLGRRALLKQRELSSVEIRAMESWTAERYVVVGWNTVFPFARMEWQLSPFVYWGAGLSYMQVGLDGGRLDGFGGWLTASYYPSGKRSGPWLMAAVVPAYLTSTRAADQTSGLTLGGAFVAGWQGQLSDTLGVGLGAGLQFVGDTGFGTTALASTGLFPSFILQISYGL